MRGRWGVYAAFACIRKKVERGYLPWGMVQAARPSRPCAPQYAGLRLSADKYLDLPDDGFKYQVLNGIVVVSPRPTPGHQLLLGELIGQLGVLTRRPPIARAYADIDVRFDFDLVYRPDIVVIRRDRIPKTPKRIDIVPDLIVEILSPGSEAMDQRTKFADYERYGVQEYWIVEVAPVLAVRAFTLTGGRYVERPAAIPGTVSSTAFPGFTLDVQALHEAWAD